MITVGNLIKEARINRGLSVEDFAELTHIRADFIRAIEESRWKELPEITVVTGFVKTISHFLDIPERQAVSILRREYPTSLKGLGGHPPRNFQKDLKKRFVWGPRLTFLIAIIFILVVVLGYLGIQYRKFNLPPHLILETPTEGQIVRDVTLEVKGQTDSDATIEVNNQPVVLDDNGKFDTKIDVSKNTQSVEVIAKSRGGKETKLSRKISFEP